MTPQGPTRIEWTSRRATDGLRTRYRPACRINHALFSVAPWIDVVLLVVAVAMLLGGRTIVPGVTVDLPAAPFREGFDSDLVLVVNPLPTTSAPASGVATPAGGVMPTMQVLVFFNDDRFNLSAEHQCASLQNAVAAYMERVGGRDALLYVDHRVNHGDVVRLVSLLRATGVRRANLAVKAL
jgi:biopolymer transport protein ExbD